MDNLTQSAQIRRTVENMAYQLLEDCKEPTREYDGDGYYLEDHWDIDKDELKQKVVFHLLENGWEFEHNDAVDSQIQYHVQQFMENELGDMIDEFRQGLADKADWERTKKSLMPSWTPKL